MERPRGGFSTVITEKVLQNFKSQWSNIPASSSLKSMTTGKAGGLSGFLGNKILRSMLATLGPMHHQAKKSDKMLLRKNIVEFIKDNNFKFDFR